MVCTKVAGGQEEREDECDCPGMRIGQGNRVLISLATQSGSQCRPELAEGPKILHLRPGWGPKVGLSVGV